MGAACVHEENATAADTEMAPEYQQQQETSPSRRQEEDISYSAKGKRKATTSPESNEDNVRITNTPRPNKTRVVAVHELITTALSEERERTIETVSSDKQTEAEYKHLAEGRFLSSSPEKEMRITRSKKKKEEKDKVSSALDKLVTVKMDKMMAKIDSLNKSINQSKTDKTSRSTVTNSETEEEANDMASICSSRIRTSELSYDSNRPRRLNKKNRDNIASISDETSMPSETYTSSIKNRNLNKRKSKKDKSIYVSSSERVLQYRMSIIVEIKITQINLNRSWSAFDLLKQRVLDSDIGLSIISEPPSNVLKTNRWFVSNDNLAAILWNVEASVNNICKLICSGNGFVIVKFREINIISCYASPNVSTSTFEDTLDVLSNCFAALYLGQCCLAEI